MALANISQRLMAAPRWAAFGALAIYRAALSPMIHAINGPACRFEPSCSEYARDALAEYGIVRGGAMALWRVGRCNPFGGHGWDPIAKAKRPSHIRFPFPLGKGSGARFRASSTQNPVMQSSPDRERRQTEELKLGF
jgi:hypothetical protein